MHPTDGPPQHEFFLMCDDLDAQLGEFRAQGVEITRPVSEQRWGKLTAIRLPSGAELPLYEPLHPIRTRSRPLSRYRTRCPRCPASGCTTRCRHRQRLHVYCAEQDQSCAFGLKYGEAFFTHQFQCRPAHRDAPGSRRPFLQGDALEVQAQSGA